MAKDSFIKQIIVMWNLFTFHLGNQIHYLPLPVLGLIWLTSSYSPISVKQKLVSSGDHPVILTYTVSLGGNKVIPTTGELRKTKETNLN